METANSGDLNYSETRAIGIRGFLMRGVSGELWFRVYNPDNSFVDYDVTHFDCEIVIIDPSAALIRNDGGDFLDYTAESMQIVK